MKRLTAKEIKKILLGVLLSDGSIDYKASRFDFYSKHKEYALYIQDVLNQITGMHTKFYIKNDKRGYVGYRVTTRKHVYWKKRKALIYNGRKYVCNYTASKIDAESLAHIWMCDGYLEHAKNRKRDTVQNIGWLCLEAFPKEELEILIKHFKINFKIDMTLNKKKWGFGYRIRIGGSNLQKLISIIYPYILDVFKYKTILFYKNKESADMSLSNAEQCIKEYTCIEDIVRYSLKDERT